MYYPYLRGKQNELLCLRELLHSNKLSSNTLPVLEPVKFSSTFFSTLKKIIELDRKIILIKNPSVGKFYKEYNEMKEKIEDPKYADKREKLKANLDEYKSILKNENILYAYIVTDKIVNRIINGEIDLKNIILINKESGDYSYYSEHGSLLKSKVTFIPKDEDFKDEVIGKTIILEDCYNKAKRNVDYIDRPDDFFSKNHLIYKKRGYEGFSDYSIVGDEYGESGFAPKAIAIHIVYFNDKKDLRIHHFVSKSNTDISDPARKFEEAMENMIEWESLVKVKKTEGLKKLIHCYQNGKFPGLGVIKKYSLMHHLELMDDFLKQK